MTENVDLKKYGFEEILALACIRCKTYAVNYSCHFYLKYEAVASGCNFEFLTCLFLSLNRT